MGYTAYLTKLLRPLGVYTLEDQSLSGGELYAVGKALDAVEQTITAGLRDAIPVTAEKEALQEYFRLSPLRPSGDAGDYRAVLLWILRARGREITSQSINSLLRLYHAQLSVRETGVNAVTVTLPQGSVTATARWKSLAEQILPCQLKITYEIV